MSLNCINYANKKVHFIGIGGISMSGLAEILLKDGVSVSGSDMKESHITEKLRALGASIYIGHNEKNVEDKDVIVYTAAISSDNPELIKSKELNLIMYNRAEFLGEIMKSYKYNIAVSGTHGKTTTTSMVSHIALSGKLDPTILVGGELDIIKGNILVGNSEYLITEACEYKESFLKFYPYIGIILNIDADHLDYYKDINHIKEAFSKFIDIIPKDGYLIANAEDKNIMSIIDKAECNVMTFGINNGTLRAKDIVFNNNGNASYTVSMDGEDLFRLNLSVPGEHNILNSLSTIGSALSLNIPYEDIKHGLESFHGTHRRFEVKGVKNGVTVIDDYAHHPTEILSSIKTALKYPHNKIYCLFQPHTYTRTYSLFNEFCSCFDGVDKLLVADIYAAREKDTGLVHSKNLAQKIKEKNIDTLYMPSFEAMDKYLKDNCTEGDLILTVGAGDINKVGESYLK
ncbi:UDP-N-acetylmuramate--L-alanine ligase [Hathewaya histolytica]|uniref:UDP-N-acetylmuramate--L-alanine ligase n=1 Tax=Hathewaya histolytica TaxID=1498 RepID=A0A4U9S1M8_HATHI|nr:UDP-N-acetylmuramate--L-alanine ligase [Hathewaya histolytica]VTQ95480.1 UDP-N-acetylmuramate--L-alanine ligase [Hathewaya histolytica]